MNFQDRDPHSRVDEMTLQELHKEASSVRDRIKRFRVSLGKFFIAKQHIIDLMTVSAVAQEPLMLVGPPGTAKSDLVVKFKDALGLRDEDYFEYVLTRFTEPSEIFGPIDINLLRDGKYVRRKQGKLPTARLVFLDEIFKSNSAILNSLLTVMNERKFYQDGGAERVNLRVLFAATNEIPEHLELDALKDRFCLKVLCNSVNEEHFVDLIDMGVRLQAYRDTNQKPWVEGHASLDDLVKANRYLSLMMAREDPGTRGEPITDRHRFFRDEPLRELRRILKTIQKEDKIFVSDRKIIKLYRLLRTHAWLLHGGGVERDDLTLLSFLGENRSEMALLEDKVPRLLGIPHTLGGP